MVNILFFLSSFVENIYQILDRKRMGNSNFIKKKENEADDEKLHLR